MLVGVLCAAVAGGIADFAGVAEGKPTRAARSGRIVLSSVFHRMRGVDLVWASGDWALLATHHGAGPFDTGWIITNPRRGSRMALAPDCHIDALGPPWIVTACPSTTNPYGPFDFERYSLRDGTHRAISASAGVPACARPPDFFLERPCASEPAGIGTDWIKWDSTCYHCGDTDYFQNIRTGEVRNDPTDRTTFADLNSPGLARRTCPGVALRRDLTNPAGVRWGPIELHGQWAVVRGDGSTVFLERCGTRRRRLLLAGFAAGSRVVANSAEVVWQARPGYLSGLFLPSLRSFRLQLPAVIAKHGLATTLALSASTLYLRDDSYDGWFWQTTIPPGR